MKQTLAVISAALLTACGGGDGPTEPVQYELRMETVTHETVVIGTYETENDCIGAGSYRATARPDIWAAWSCKEV